MSQDQLAITLLGGFAVTVGDRDVPHEVQNKYHTRYINYWLDVDAGKIFCLVEAPDAPTAHAVHREAHGLVADEIHPVVQG